MAKRKCTKLAERCIKDSKVTKIANLSNNFQTYGG